MKSSIWFRVVLAGLAIAGVVVAQPVSSYAQCVPLEQCDDLSNGCDACPNSTGLSGYEVEQGPSIKPSYSESPGSRLAAKHLPTIVGYPPTTVPEVLKHVALSRIAVETVFPIVGAGLPVQVASAGAVAGATLQPEAAADHGAVFVPVDQGVPRPLGGDGKAVEHDPDGHIADPVDPITGELVIHHTDLAFPSFGISFRHDRTYRSRIDYQGPLGPGWDHGYNQRLLSVPDVQHPTLPSPHTGDPFTPPEASLPEAPVDPQAGCGPVLALTTGQGTTLRFREMGRTETGSGTTVVYQSPAARLTLSGSLVDGEATWALTSQDGDTRRFDANGLLVAWSDANGVGLTFTWQPGSEHDWRLWRVADSAGRDIEYRYDDVDRLVHVTEPGSGLDVSYEYGGQGELRRATGSDARTETYEYDVLGGGRGDWVAEGQLQASCEQLCAVSASSCDAGGACDLSVAAATADCLASCDECAAECRDSCGGVCHDECKTCDLACEGECAQPDEQAMIAQDCLDLYESSGAHNVCSHCDENLCEGDVSTCTAATVCITATSSGGDTDIDLCAEGSGFWDQVEDTFRYVALGLTKAICYFFHCEEPTIEDQLDAICDNHTRQCCKNGDQCAADSCNIGVACGDACRTTWLGLPVPGNCLAPEFPYECNWDSSFAPQPGTPEYEHVLECAGTASDWAAAHGCQAILTDSCEHECSRDCRGGDAQHEGCEPPCLDACDDYCDTQCHVADCADYCESLDFVGICETSCSESCVETAHAAGVDPGPKYGQPADLDYNLVRVYDGAGQLWLENTYGSDVRSPDFDTVVFQRYGDFTAEMEHVDLRAIAAGDAAPPASSVAALVDDLDHYESVDICPYRCTAETVRPGDLVLPLGDLVLVFSDDGGDITPTHGLPIVKSNLPASTVPPTLLELSRKGSQVVAKADRRTSRSNPLATLSSGSVSVALETGEVALIADGGGSWTLSGDTASQDALLARGDLTVLTDKAGQLRVYPGHPVTALTLASGSCTKPFRVQRTGDDRIQLEPADACKGDLWLAPLASASSAELVHSYLASGQAAIATSQLRPSTLAPSRDGATWRSWGTGAYTREKPASDVATKAAVDMAVAQMLSTPMFSLPTSGSGTDPFYVFHHVDLTAKLIPPYDMPWGPGDNAPPGYEPPCDPTTPDLAARGVGPDAPGAHPTSVTVATDLHGARWSLYADASGRMIRTVNHETGAVWSFQHDPAGQLIGIEAPDHARQCLRYDAVGNLTERLSLPTHVSGLADPDPIRERIVWSLAPSRPTVLLDPRDLGHPLQQLQYDTLGNVTSITDALGHTTTISLVGGSGASRAQPKAVADPSGAVRAFSWDETTGTLHTETIDPGGAALTREQVADEAGRPVWAQSPLGMVQTWSWDGARLGGTSWSGDGHAGLTTYGYDSDGKISSTTTGSHQTQFHYDPIGSLVGTLDVALDGSVEPAASCQRLAPGGRVLESVSPEGHRVRFHYDGEGHVVSVEAGDLGPSTEDWDDDCPDHPPGPSVSGVVATFAYDLNGRLIRSTDPRGIERSVTYDGLGRPVILTEPDGTTLRRGYDALGNTLWESVYAPGSWTPYRPPSWGDAGLLGASTQRFDDAGRIAERRVWHFDDTGAAIGDGEAVTTYGFDDTARTMAVTDDGGRTTTVKRDAAGRVFEVELPEGSRLKTTYLDGGRTIQRTYPVAGTTQSRIARLTAWGALATAAVLAGSSEIATAQVQYDDRLRPTTVYAATGLKSTTTYDAFDRPVTVLTTPGEQVDLTYDREGRVRERRSDAGDGMLSSWQFAYDALGRAWQTTDPEGAVTQVTAYDGLSALPDEIVDPRGTHTFYTWSSQGQLIGLLADASGTSGIRDVALSFQRDPLGRVTAAMRDDGLDGEDVTSWFRYDSFGLVTAEGDDSFGPGAERSHIHDGVGRRVTSQLGGHLIERRYDDLDRLTSLQVDVEAPSTATWEYAGPGPAIARNLRSGLHTSYGRDSLGRLNEIVELSPGGSLLARWSWGQPFDGVPRVATQQKVSTITSSVFGVDGAGRVTGERHGLSGVPFAVSPTQDTTSATAQAQGYLGSTQATRYGLTGRGTWTSRDRNGTHTVLSSDARDGYRQVGTTPWELDDSGAVVQDDAARYTYDALGQLAGYAIPTAAHSYQRDAFGRIVSEKDISTGAVTHYAYDGLRRTFRRTPDGQLDITVDGAGLDEHVVTILASGKRLYLHQDRLGSVQLITDEYAKPREWIQYTAFGEPTIRNKFGAIVPTTMVGNRFGFHGHPQDWTAGLVDMRARAYRPAFGRFLSLDPMGLGAGSPNLYALGDGAALSFVDPLGLSKEYTILNEGCYCALSHHNGATQWVGEPDRNWTGPRIPVDRVADALAHVGDNPTEFEQGLMGGGDRLLATDVDSVPTHAEAILVRRVSGKRVIEDIVAWRISARWNTNQIVDRYGNPLTDVDVAPGEALLEPDFDPIDAAFLAQGGVGIIKSVIDAGATALAQRAAAKAAGAVVDAAAADGAQATSQTLFHYTTEGGSAGILKSEEIWASTGAKNARHGTGQYFTDIAPEAIGGRTLAETPAGKMSLGQLSSRLFRVPWNTGKLSHFLEIDVAGLGARQVAPNIWLIESEGSLSIAGRLVRSGATLR